MKMQKPVETLVFLHKKTTTLASCGSEFGSIGSYFPPRALAPETISRISLVIAA